MRTRAGPSWALQTQMFSGAWQMVLLLASTQRVYARPVRSSVYKPPETALGAAAAPVGTTRSKRTSCAIDRIRIVACAFNVLGLLVYAVINNAGETH